LTRAFQCTQTNAYRYDEARLNEEGSTLALLHLSKPLNIANPSGAVIDNKMSAIVWPTLFGVGILWLGHHWDQPATMGVFVKARIYVTQAQFSAALDFLMTPNCPNSKAVELDGASRALANSGGPALLRTDNAVGGCWYRLWVRFSAKMHHAVCRVVWRSSGCMSVSRRPLSGIDAVIERESVVKLTDSSH